MGAIAAVDLPKLLLTFAGVPADEVERYGRCLYRRLYLDNDRYGVRQCHDGQLLIFHARQFDHAFFTTTDRFCHPERKDQLRKSSIERIHWIGPLASGCVEESACYEVPSPTGRQKPPNRLYAVYPHPFVVWLEPRKAVGWKFASAYACSMEEIRKYTRGGRTVWKWKKPCD